MSEEFLFVVDEDPVGPTALSSSSCQGNPGCVNTFTPPVEDTEA